MYDVARQYFVNIKFQKQGGVFSPIIDVIHSSVSTVDNDKLTTPFTKAKFRSAIFSMHPDKCAGPDGYSPGFYQHFWNLCSDDIFKECCAWLDTEQISSRLEHY